MINRFLQSLVAVFLVAVLVVSVQVMKKGERYPQSDEYRYLHMAENLVDYGVITERPRKDGDVKLTPSMKFAPVTPLYFAGIMSVDPVFKETISCILKAGESQAPAQCALNYGAYLPIQIVVAGLGLVLIWQIAALCGAGVKTRWFCLFVALSSGQHAYFARHFLTEGLVLFFFSAFTFFLCRAAHFLIETKAIRTWDWVLAGSALAICSLNRPTFVFLGYAIIACLPVLLIWAKYKNPAVRKSRAKAFKPALFFALGFGLLLLPLLIRNWVQFESLALTSGHGAHILIERVSYNQMTMTEWLAGWIYWLPDFGDNLAFHLFGAENIERLRWYAEEGFYRVGNDELQKQIRAEAAASEQNVLAYTLQTYVIRDLPTHVIVTLLLCWRGMFLAKNFGLITHVFAAGQMVSQIRSRRIVSILTVAAPALFILGLNGFLSVNAKRYNVGLLPYLSIFGSIGLLSIGQWIFAVICRKAGRSNT
ncbi:hypothetical protein [Aestuariispira insulae]|uniref:Dolichyl-phosphate-mannose-protein mannosyltransferase n=1 Tax=Aestuariispira insulae TaxID=1461337 RepID=A0A3D9HNE1_9PROT|nr:hypothetical protein [Aestuariispira insulae]RED50988.1 hypothetical protein DFP90_104264 [Aestuariispira insulae]